MRGLVALVGVLASLAVIASAAPRGRVVRVERARPISNVTPVLCDIKGDDLRGMCVGPQPHRGDVVLLVDARRTVAEVRLERVRPMSRTCDSVWEVTGELLRGDPGSSKERPIGIIDSTLDTRTVRQVADESRIQAPSNDPDARIMIGLDRNADGAADIIMTQAPCLQATSSASCYHFWTRRAAGMTHVWSADLRACY